MTIFLHLSLLLTSHLYASTSTTTAVTLTTPHPSNSTSPIPPHLTTPYRCFPISRHFTTPRPLFPDCTAAILLLPNSDALGTFHTSGPIDDHSLPVQKTSGTCRVIIDLVSVVAEEKGSWAGVSVVAGKLNVQCVLIPSTGRRFTGGITYAGVEQRVSIMLDYNPLGDSGGGDGNEAVVVR